MPIPLEDLLIVEERPNLWYLIDAKGCQCCLPPVSDCYPTLAELCVNEPRAIEVFMRGNHDVN